MGKNVKEYVKILSREIKPMDRIRDILELSGPLVCVYHNSRRGKFVSHSPGNSEIKQ